MKIIATIFWSTDENGKPVDFDEDNPLVSYYGPFDSHEAAIEWVDDYPDDIDYYDITVDEVEEIEDEVLNDPAEFTAMMQD